MARPGVLGATEGRCNRRRFSPGVSKAADGRLDRQPSGRPVGPLGSAPCTAACSRGARLWL